MSWIPNGRSAGRRLPAASQAPFHVKALPSARERTILALMRSINRSRSNSKTAPCMLMFILPAVARTGPNGLTVFYVPLHPKPQRCTVGWIIRWWVVSVTPCIRCLHPSILLVAHRHNDHGIGIDINVDAIGCHLVAMPKSRYPLRERRLHVLVGQRSAGRCRST